MNAFTAWMGRQAPDMVATCRRFPLAVMLLAVGTVLVILLANEIFTDDDSIVGRLAVGVLGGTSYAVAGRLLAESRQLPTWVNVVTVWLLPIAVAFSLQIENTNWIVSLMLPVVGVFWMSVAGFTRWGQGEERQLQQDRFWWLNHRAVTTGVVAVIGFLLVALGLFAIDRSLSFLFGLEIGDLIYKIIFPVAGLFLTPLYWLSTLPELDEFARSEIDEPDFLSRAIGFLGQFVLSPLLIIYALILIAYGVQIVVIGRLPEGLLGWMVLVFIITGAANWLVLHPGFMHKRLSVQFFRRTWFWLTIIPIALYAVAVWVRVSNYGFTEERVLLIAGGLWAALLTLAYLTRLLADIRIIPGLAGLLLLIVAVGPWNMFNIARTDQMSRLDAALVTAQTDDGFTWTEQTAAPARGAINYLTSTDDADAELAALLDRYGISVSPGEGLSSRAVADLLDLPDQTLPDRETFTYLERGIGSDPVLLSGTPLLYPEVTIHDANETQVAGLHFQLDGQGLRVWHETTDVITVPLANWIDSQLGDQLQQPAIAFELEGVRYRLIVSRATVSVSAEDEGAVRSLTFIEAMLAASEALPEVVDESVPIE